MGSRLSTLTLVTILAGCGGAGGSVAKDVTAPTLVLSASNTSPTGGDTVVISVTATDNIDPSVSYVLSCTGGGQLTNNSLILPNVSADTTVLCTATASDAAGNAGTGTLSLMVKPSTATVTLATGSESVIAGGSGLLFVDNQTLPLESYDATIGGVAVKLARVNGNGLMFTAPLTLPSGTRRLQFAINGRSYGFDVAVTGPVEVPNPRTAILEMMNQSKASLATRLASSTLTAAERTTIQDGSARVDAAIAAVASMNDADLSKLASFLAANGAIAVAGKAATSYEPIKLGSDCGPAFRAFAVPAVGTVLWAGVLTGSVALGFAVASAAPALVIPDIILSGLGIAAGGILSVQYGFRASRAYSDMKTKCYTETKIDVFSFLDQQTSPPTKGTVSALAVDAKQAFANKVSRSIRVSRTFSPQEAVRAELQRLLGDISSKVAPLFFVPDDLRAQFSALRSEGTEIVPAANITIGAISRGDIAGSFERISSDAIRLTFSYTGETPPAQNIDFTFAINRSEEQTATVSAMLAIKLPEADDAAVVVTQDTLASATVQVRNATSLEIVRRPTNGVVTISANGSFQYTPASRYFGPDSFTYRARNAEGVSREATVTLSVIRRFEGAWTITSRSTTTAESRPGLCPTENRTFTVNVAKISDTQYTTVYQGSTITLTMANRDDPAGLSGSGSASYAQDGGTTTETLSIAVPNSTTLTGSGTFRYTNPSASCSGTLSFTGRR